MTDAADLLRNGFLPCFGNMSLFEIILWTLAVGNVSKPHVVILSPVLLVLFEEQSRLDLGVDVSGQELPVLLRLILL